MAKLCKSQLFPTSEEVPYIMWFCYYILQDAGVFNSPEVDRLSAEIDDLVKEKLVLETHITQREADIRIKSSELKSLQVSAV